jgi:hypothetical protein
VIGDNQETQELQEYLVMQAQQEIQETKEMQDPVILEVEEIQETS